MTPKRKHTIVGVAPCTGAPTPPPDVVWSGGRYRSTRPIVETPHASGERRKATPGVARSVKGG